jgi:hypothetical protein
MIFRRMNMKKIVRKMSVTLFILVLMVTGCQGQETQSMVQDTLIVQDLNGMDLQKVNQYTMDLKFIPEKAMVEAMQKIDYINNEKVSLQELYFHLYPNSFKTKENAPFLFDDFHQAYPGGFQPGYIDIKNVRVNGQPIQYEFTNKDETILKISLEEQLKPAQKLFIEMDYIVKLPPAQERFGYGEDTFNFGNWYPIVAVYDEKGWNLDPYYAIGDPFYSDVSNYNVTIETPKSFTVACSGNIIQNQIVDGKRIWKIDAKLMRDFAWVASKNFEVAEKKVGETVVKLYFIKDQTIKKEIKELALLAAEDALKTFNKVYGKYPYGQYSVVQTNFPSGMEYPGIIFVGKQFYDDAWADYLEIVIVHETAHQWWYGVVGNDEVDEAWLDESFAAYSEVVYTKEMFGEKQGEEYHRLANENEYQEFRDTMEDEVILKPLNQFKNWGDYGSLVYSKGAMFLNEIYDQYGKEKFYRILKEYYKRYRFKNATTRDFKEVCEEILKDDLAIFFDQWLLAK